MYQADKQAASTREQWLRQIRREVYARFLSRARELVAVMDESMHQDHPWESLPGEFRARARREVRTGFARVEQTAQEMILEAKPALSGLVDKFLDAADEFQTFMIGEGAELEGSSRGLNRYARLANEQLRLIVLQARESLQGPI
ncbi:MULTISPECIES: hypothetical protein [unclassified Streptomyces]|uniref:hypothetical protein n=1 Tax=unclassified Streptomyces TaxID=2593676 RepID=UPI002E374377|nr:hypothetical protein [Streptomyces sp. NBC_01361]